MHRWLGALTGILAGIVTQSTNAVTHVTISVVSAGIIDKRRAMPIPIWAHVGASLLVMLVAVNLRIGASYIIALAGFAIGTETWGSIVCPSAFCGVSGLRPTYGRVSRRGAMALSYSMDKIGPLARSAEDCTNIFAAIAGHDPLDRSTLPVDKAAFTYSPAADLKGRSLRIGWLTNAWKQFDPGVGKIVIRSHGLSSAYCVCSRRFAFRPIFNGAPRHRTRPAAGTRPRGTSPGIRYVFGTVSPAGIF